MRVPETPGCRNSKIALRTSILAGHLAFGVVHLFHDPLAGFDIVPASIGQRHPSRRSLKQLGFQTRL